MFSMMHVMYMPQSQGPGTMGQKVHSLCLVSLGVEKLSLLSKRKNKKNTILFQAW